MQPIAPTSHGQISNITDGLQYFIPEIWLAGLFLVIFITDLIVGKRNALICRAVALISIGFVLFLSYRQSVQFQTEHVFFNNMLKLDRPGILFKVVIDAIAFILLIYIPWDKALRAHYKGLADLYSIIVASVFGLHLMVMAVNLLSIYLAVEMVSIASYLLAAYRSDTPVSTEAGMKYVLFGATSSAIMLYGISLLYGFGGSLDILQPSFATSLGFINPVSITLAVALVMLGIGFKLSFVPMHFWVPDVYQGAATPVTAYLSTLPKIAGFALLLHFLVPVEFLAFFHHTFDIRFSLSVIGIVTMLVGNLAAIWQTNIKRLLAYSSIGHTGFALMAITCFSDQGTKALIFYLAVYAIANIAALMLATYYVNKIGAHTLESYKGVGLRYPLPSICFVVVLISLAGLPITAGFNGKVLVFSAVYKQYQLTHNFWLLGLMITGAVTTVIALFYYIKIPLYMFLKKNEHHADDLIVNHKYLLIMICVLTAFLLVLGVYPQVLNDLVH